MTEINSQLLFLLLYLGVSGTAGYGTKSASVPQNSYMNFEELYLKGKEAYLNNNFKDCVEHIEAALSEYKNYNKVVNSCKLECKASGEPKKQSVILHVQDYKQYESLIHETLCLMNCKRGRVNPNRVEQLEDEKNLQDFLSRKTYDYLQLCYFQTKRNQDAANAAYTNSIFNPEHEIMSENVAYYLEQVDVDPDRLVNLEAPEFVSPYLAGKANYALKDWAALVNNMEEAIRLYLQEEEFCRVQCEKPFNMGWYPDFVSSVSNHFTFCLKCKLNCATELHTINGHMEDDLLPLMYHYLQFGYYMLSNYETALDCSLTYLQFRPDSDDSGDMVNNVEYYRAASGSTGTARKEAVRYIEREQDELALIDFIESSFVFSEQEVSEEKRAKASSDFGRLDTLQASDLSLSSDGQPDQLTDHLGQNEAESTKDSDQSWAEWSESEGRYIIDDSNNLMSAEDLETKQLLEEIRPRLLSPPPVVKFEL